MKKISEFMKQEHLRLDTLWEDFSREETKEERALIFQTFSDKLLAHLAIEDEVLSPIFNKHLGVEKGQTTVIKEDHKV